MIQKAQAILQFANFNITLPSVWTDTLYTAIKSGHREAIVTAITSAGDAAADLLDDEGYNAFCDHLFEQEKEEDRN
jgi:hypothetical protein